MLTTVYPRQGEGTGQVSVGLSVEPHAINGDLGEFTEMLQHRCLHFVAGTGMESVFVAKDFTDEIVHRLDVARRDLVQAAEALGVLVVRLLRR